MTTALLDVNVLTALLWPTHEHHDTTHRWFGDRGQERWATCTLTQLGFVRIVSNPAFSRDALTVPASVALLRENLSQPAHEFWTESMQVPTAIRAVESALRGYRQLTDAYLLAFASRRGGVLATFDRGLRELAGERFGAALEVVPTR